MKLLSINFAIEIAALQHLDATVLQPLCSNRLKLLHPLLHPLKKIPTADRDFVNICVPTRSNSLSPN